MKILIYGPGAIGASHGFIFCKHGHDVSILVRKEKRKAFQDKGISIQFKDFNKKPEQTEQTLFRPKVISQLKSDNDYDLIMVCLNNHQVEKVLSDEDMVQMFDLHLKGPHVEKVFMLDNILKTARQDELEITTLNTLKKTA